MLFDGYEEYLVYETLKSSKKNAGIEILSRHRLDGISYIPDLYAADGIPSLGIVGPTVIEVKKMLSYASMKNIVSAISSYRR